MLATTRKRSVRLGVEALEARWVPAGNVTAQLLVSPGETVLSVVGDNEANQLRILEDAPGHVRIEGLEATTINGQAADELTTSEDLRGLHAEVALGNGNDTFLYESGEQFRHLFTIDTGKGDDAVTVLARGEVVFLNIDTGVGNDQVMLDLAPASVVEDFLVNTGVGADTVRLRADPDGDRPLLFGSSFLILTEEGDDVVQLEGEFDVFGPVFLDIHLGAGDDTLIGDSETVLSVSGEAVGGLGHDTVLNASYFLPSEFRLHSFETIEDA